MKKIYIIVMIVFVISACGAKPEAVIPTSAPLPTITFTPAPLPTVTPVCVSSVPAQADIDRALTYTEDILIAPDWEQTYSVLENSVAVTWQNIFESGIIYLEAIIFPCSYEEPDLDHYFSDENWNAIFANYESHQLNVQCKMDSGLRLYQFSAQSGGSEYEIRYWVENDTDIRIISTMMIFPAGAESPMDDYALSLFPDLPNCS